MKRNPAVALPRTLRGWTQGVDIMDAVAAVGGLAATTTLPGLLVKDTTTSFQKMLKLLVSIGVAFGAGALGSAMVSPKAGKAAVIGGVAGTAAQAIGMFTNIQIGQPSTKRLSTMKRGIGESRVVVPGAGEGIQLSTT